MNYPMAIVISAALIAGAMFFSNQNDLDAAGNAGCKGILLKQHQNLFELVKNNFT